VKSIDNTSCVWSKNYSVAIAAAGEFYKDSHNTL